MGEKVTNIASVVFFSFLILEGVIKEGHDMIDVKMPKR